MSDTDGKSRFSRLCQLSIALCGVSFLAVGSGACLIVARLREFPVQTSPQVARLLVERCSPLELWIIWQLMCLSTAGLVAVVPIAMFRKFDNGGHTQNTAIKTLIFSLVLTLPTFLFPMGAVGLLLVRSNLMSGNDDEE